MRNEMHKRLLRLDLGKTDYVETWDLQKRLVELRRDGKIPDCLILTEHNPVITMGRATSKENLLYTPAELKTRGVELFEIERGGDITFHGPGQLVAYPIIDLDNHGRDLHKYLRDLERVVIETLDDLGIKAGLKPGLTGVWADDHKLAAIGVAVKRWVTYHGLALNVSTDLDYFKLINPCGITVYPVGSIESNLEKKTEFDRVAGLLALNFSATFNCELEATSLESLLFETVEAN
ncbi:MAG: lipoyl(octanoyl) transferase LipB [candidate division Zixibacteria bacterium]